MKKINVILILLIFVVCLKIHAISDVKKLFEDAPVYKVKIPQKHYGALLDEKATSLKRLRYAESISVDIDILNFSKKETKGSYIISKMAVQSDGASNLGFTFKNFILTKGEKISVYNSIGQHLVDYTMDDNTRSGFFPTSPLVSDLIYIKCKLKSDKEKRNLKIINVNHGFMEVFSQVNYRRPASDDCNIDINSELGNNWQLVKHSVVRIDVGGSWCTGTLINNTANDGKPYIFTANHCINEYTNMNTVKIYFNYENLGEYKEQSLTGATLLAGSRSHDFSLMLMDEKPPASYRPVYAGWTLKEEPSDSSYCIHHPGGGFKKISFDKDYLSISKYLANPIPEFFTTEEVFWKVSDWESGTTLGGSSGSALFNKNGYVIGSLSGGDANCSNPVNDFYSAFYVNWNRFAEPAKQLKHWLAPDAPGVTSLKTLAGVYFTADKQRIYPGETVRFTNSSNEKYEVEHWSIDGKKYTSDSPEVTFEKSGIFDVKLVVKSGMIKDSLVRKKFIRVGYVLYPNPTESEATLSMLTLPEDFNTNSIKVYNMSGKEVEVSVSVNDENDLKINFLGQQSGTYFIKCDSHGLNIFERIVILN